MTKKLLSRLMPDFIGIGAMRSGTSWFSKNLNKHPDIYPRTREIHFFDKELDGQKIPIFPKKIEAQLRYGYKFIRGKISGKVCGDYTPAYAILEKETIALVQNWMPDIKLLFIMRDPVQRAWSHARKGFMKRNGIHILEAPKNQVIEYLNKPGFYNRSDYSRCLENWMHFYDYDQFFIAFLDEAKTEPEKMFREVFSFLGVNSDIELHKEDLYSAVNTRPKFQMPDWIDDYLSDSLYSNNQRLEAIIGRKVPWGAHK